MSRITAFLGLDVSPFQAGIDKANTALGRFKSLLKAGDVGNGLRQMLGAGAIIQGFRGILQAAQETRDEARKLGTTIDAGTASVAAYADRWDQAKSAVASFGIQALSVFTRVGRAIGKGLGTGSSDEEVAALGNTEKTQEQTERDLKANQERLNREIEAAKKERTTATREMRNSAMSDKERELALEKEINELYKKRENLLPGSLEQIKTDTEIAKRTTEKERLIKQRSNKPAVQPSDLKGEAAAFQMSISDVAKARPVGRRSERERMAAEVVDLEERGKRAEAAGRFELAANLRRRGIEQARKLGFGSRDLEVKIKGGTDESVGLGGEPDAMREGSWDARFGGQLSARNAALTAQYGGDYKRADSFERAQSVEKTADAALNEAAKALEAAAAELKNVEIEIDAPDA